MSWLTNYVRPKIRALYSSSSSKPEVPENLRNAMKLHFVEDMDQVLAVALERPIPEPLAETTATETIAPVPPVGDAPTAHQ